MLAQTAPAAPDQMHFDAIERKWVQLPASSIPAPQAAALPSEGVFSMIDRNNDGVISKDEWVQAKQLKASTASGTSQTMMTYAAPHLKDADGPTIPMTGPLTGYAQPPNAYISSPVIDGTQPVLTAPTITETVLAAPPTPPTSNAHFKVTSHAPVPSSFSTAPPLLQSAPAVVTAAPIVPPRAPLASERVVPVNHVVMRGDVSRNRPEIVDNSIVYQAVAARESLVEAGLLVQRQEVPVVQERVKIVEREVPVPAPAAPRSPRISQRELDDIIQQQLSTIHSVVDKKIGQAMDDMKDFVAVTLEGRIQEIGQNLEEWNVSLRKLRQQVQQMQQAEQMQQVQIQELQANMVTQQHLFTLERDVRMLTEQFNEQGNRLQSIRGELADYVQQEVSSRSGMSDIDGLRREFNEYKAYIDQAMREMVQRLNGLQDMLMTTVEPSTSNRLRNLEAGMNELQKYLKGHAIDPHAHLHDHAHDRGLPQHGEESIFKTIGNMFQSSGDDDLWKVELKDARNPFATPASSMDAALFRGSGEEQHGSKSGDL